MGIRFILWAVLWSAVASLLQACGTAPAPLPEASPGQTSATKGQLIARDDDFAIVVAQSGDTLESLAKGYLGDSRYAWRIADFNNITQVRPGQEVIVPLKSRNPVGVNAQGFQTVPILCYHRFGSSRSKLVVTPAAFAAQMEFLARNHYRVIPLSQLQGFLQGREPLPQRAVVITIDDGYRSTYEVAYPILKRYGFPATIFLYSDFVGATDAMTWHQMQEIAHSGSIEIQPHSKTHSNLTLRLPQESEVQYRERMRHEVDTPANAIEDRLTTKVNSFAYPYGDTNDVVVQRLVQRGVGIGVTVTPGGNGFFANPYMLRRTMVFGDDDMTTFASKLAVFNRTAGQ